MYQVRTVVQLLGARKLAPSWRVPRAVVLLGVTSLFTDAADEMIAAVLPMYLLYGLDLSPLAAGTASGLQAGGGAVVRLLGAWVADRTQRVKAAAVMGYAVSLASKLGLVLFGTGAVSIGVWLGVDRVGKGFRTAPRDALIAEHGAASLGSAFGAHRALDALGALGGPVLTLTILQLAPAAYEAVLVTSVCLALIGVSVIGLLVPRAAADASPRGAAAGRAGGGYRILLAPGVRGVALVAVVAAAARVGEGLLWLAVQRRLELSPGALPLLYVASAGVAMLFAWPAGQLADRLGATGVVIAGQLALGGCYAALLLVPSRAVVVPCVLLSALHGAATDGVLTALVTSTLPSSVRTGGLAAIGTATDLAKLGTSVAFGGAWSAWGLGPAFALQSLLLGIALCVAVVALPRRTPEAAT